MQKKFLAVALAIAFTAASAVAAYSFTCEVTAASNTSITLKCKARNVKKVAVGNKVKVRVKQKRAAVEGC